MGDCPAAKTRLGLHQSDLNNRFFETVVRGIDKDAALVTWSGNYFDSGTNGIVSYLLGDQSNLEDRRLLGFLAFNIKYRLEDGNEIFEKNVVLKIKTRGKAIGELFKNMCEKVGGDIAEGYRRFHLQLGFMNAEHHDIIALTLDEPCLHAIRPKIYHYIYDNANDIFAYVMDDFRSDLYSHLDTVNTSHMWSESDIMHVLEGMASFHARFYGRTDEIPNTLSRWIVNLHRMTKQPEKQFLWRAMQKEAHLKFPNMVDCELASILKSAAENVTRITSYLEESPQTLIHNDLQNRNVCLRTTSSADTKRLCAYDWEVCGIGCPQRDIAEFLGFTLPPDTGISIWVKYREGYRNYLLQEIKNLAIQDSAKILLCESLEEEKFKQVFDMCVLELLYIRLMMYCVTHQVIKLPYLPAVLANVGSYVKHISKQYDFL